MPIIKRVTGTRRGCVTRQAASNSGKVMKGTTEGKVQEEELDSWRAVGERGPGDEGAGRNRHGFSLRDFRSKK
jgi:hypothetical protein